MQTCSALRVHLHGDINSAVYECCLTLAEIDSLALDALVQLSPEYVVEAVLLWTLSGSALAEGLCEYQEDPESHAQCPLSQSHLSSAVGHQGLCQLLMSIAAERLP